MTIPIIPKPSFTAMPAVPPAPSDLSALRIEYHSHTPDLGAGWMFYFDAPHVPSNAGAADGQTVAIKR